MRSLLLLAAALAGPVAGPGPGPGPAPLARFRSLEYRGSDPGAPAPGAREYRNPVLAGFYPDPSIVRVGADFYLVNSSFAFFPGLPIFHSRDLVHWRQIGNAIDRPGQLDFKQVPTSFGLFAPSISHHDGRFRIVNTCVECGGNYIVSASSPAGPWSQPVFLPALSDAIDPSLAWDERGQAYVVYNGPPPGGSTYPGHRAIWLRPVDPETGRTGMATLLVNAGTNPRRKPQWIEGPHLFAKDGWWYLVAAEGGTAEGHSEVVFRSRSIAGPYTPGPNNPILTQRDLPPARPLPVTSTGHADLVALADGRWFAVFLGTRPYRGDFYDTGRETFLMPVRWKDGWPVITGPGQPVPLVAPAPLPRQRSAAPPQSGPIRWATRFGERRLGPEWLMLRTPRERWYSLGNAGLTLRPRTAGLGSFANPSFLGRRLQNRRADLVTELRFEPSADGEMAGLAAFQNDEFWYALAIGRAAGQRQIELRRRNGKASPVDGVLLASVAAPPGAVRLRITLDSDRADFAWASAGGRWRPLLAGADATLLSTARAGGFVGTILGPFAQRRP
ncbi:glycoside hydrolase family 43 protein [Sphingomonas ginkgonis]|uniref:Glycoside hydrolase family 43 protein n=1 Tax=Sphingomonas ginkgonis TaxID=2315330 RepID=A0A3R9Y4U1_9SPHN|nr:glycoside hydrolase family 43 protein [Sphingomonas ginkgonis]RST30201.1 glycoside hydrolase family 43 protein [Sphingomonas ginkgonis]